MEAVQEGPDDAVSVDAVRRRLLRDGYVRIDERVLDGQPKLKNNNVVHDTLSSAEGALQRYEMYQHGPSGDVVALLNFGPRTVGLPGIVHGGTAALLFDNTFGWCFFNNGFPAGFTAYLHVDYRSPLRCSTGDVLMRVRVSRVEGRKVYLEGKLTTLAEDRVFSEASALFIAPRAKAKG